MAGHSQLANPGLPGVATNRIGPPAVVSEATDEYLASEDSIGNWIADRCVVDTTAWENVTALFGSYSDCARIAG
jgi:phage/plasmid-associated DNA primase